MDAESLGNIHHPRPTKAHLLHHCQVNNWRRPKPDSAIDGCRTTGLTTLANHSPLKLGHSAQKLQHHSTYRRLRLQWLRQALERGAGISKLPQDPKQVHQAARQAINLVNDEYIARLELRQKRFEKWSRQARASLLLDDLDDSRLSEGLSLQSRVLLYR
jgi:hypothetical protein